MTSCKTVIETIEKRSVFGLSLKERVQLKLHLFMCKNCGAYERQSVAIDSALSKLKENNEQESKQLSEEKKTLIRKSLSEL